MKWVAIYVAALMAFAVAVVATSGHASQKLAVTSGRQQTETIYLRNLSPRYMSDAEIKSDIPAWEHAANVDFAGYWHTTQYRLVFIGRKQAPVGSISAVFVKSGPISGALAYHWLGANAPQITVYTGTGDYYGFNNSVSFTHELFELAADPITSYVNQGYPSDFYWVEKPNLSIHQVPVFAIGWFNEVCDPVEANYYLINGVQISDFITPAWFNDGVGQRYDFLGVAQQSFWIMPGGYAQYLDFQGWHQITNFRKAKPTDSGFYKSDPKGRNDRHR